MTTDEPRENRVELAWDQAARGYDAYFAPRFAPYLGAAIGALLARREELPSGAILVPCVGPGRELCPLARAFPDRPIAASDLSGEMVKLARERSAQFPNVNVERADAMTLSAPSTGLAALVSVFGLQLLPDPAAALGAWLSELSIGGLAVIVYWPRVAEQSGPFFSMRRALRKAGVADGAWQEELSARAAENGGRVLTDVPLAFEIQHDDAAAAWSALTLLGPLRGLALTRGQDLIDALGAEFVAELPAGPIVHTPAARLLIIERQASG
jgi:trans-aconitate methyltransferase